MCPDSLLDDISISEFVVQAQLAISVKSNCSFMSASNWLDTASASCPGVEIRPTGVAGYLNPLSLPANFPGTEALSNYPGSVASITQYLGYTGTVLVQSWTDDCVQTYTLAFDGNIAAVAAMSTSTATSTATLMTSAGQDPPNRASVGVWPGLPSGISFSTSTSKTAATTHPSKSDGKRLSVSTGVLILLLISVIALTSALS